MPFTDDSSFPNFMTEMGTHQQVHYNTEYNNPIYNPINELSRLTYGSYPSNGK